MQRADEMILLCSLYNKISEKYTSSTTEREFKKAAQKLVNAGHINSNTVNDALYCLFPNEREKIIESYKKQGKEESNIGYSKGFNKTRAQKLIDDVLSDTPSVSSKGFSSEPDPCCRSGGGRSSC